MTAKKQFRQCRLRRKRREGDGYSETVAYIPTHGSNGTPVRVGATVVLTENDDTRPWDIIAVSDHTVDASYFSRKRDERRHMASIT